MNLNQLLDICANGDTDYRLAQKLGIPRQRICHYRKGDSFPKDDVIERMIEMSGANPVEAYLAVYSERMSNRDVALTIQNHAFC